MTESGISRFVSFPPAAYPSENSSLRSFTVSSASFLPYFSHPRWEKYGRNMGELRANERTNKRRKVQKTVNKIATTPPLFYFEHSDKQNVTFY